MKQIPTATQSERYVITHLLNDSTIHYRVFSILHTELCFSTANYRKIYAKMLEFNRDGLTFDMPIIAQELPELMSEIAGISSEVTSGAQIEEHTQAVYEAYARRELALVAQNFKTQMFDTNFDILDAINEFNTKQVELISTASKDDKHISVALEEMFEIAKKKFNKDESLKTVKTGFTYFDDFSGGIQKGDLVVVAGETSNGKTTLGLNIASNASKRGTISAIFSYEMPIYQLSARIVAHETREYSKNLVMGEYDLGKLETISDNCARLSQRGIYLVKPNTSNFNRLVNEIVRMVKQHGIELVVIDYLQLLTNLGNRGNQAESIAEMSNRLKTLAVELDISIILISQLARDRNNPRPSISRLKGSGDIENAADTIIMPFLPYRYNLMVADVLGESVEIMNNAVIIVGKGRNIGTTEFVLEFKKEIPAFFNYSKDDAKIINYYETQYKQDTPF